MDLFEFYIEIYLDFTETDFTEFALRDYSRFLSTILMLLLDLMPWAFGCGFAVPGSAIWP